LQLALLLLQQQLLFLQLQLPHATLLLHELNLYLF
jgi:hypothetical protein